MHPILRIFPYQTDASLSVLGHIGSYDQGGQDTQRSDLEHDVLGTWRVDLYKVYKVTT